MKRKRKWKTVAELAEIVRRKKIKRRLQAAFKKRWPSAIRQAAGDE